MRTHNLGLAAGFISGYGFTYRYWGESKNGFQATFIPALRVTDDETFANTSIGLMGLRSLHTTPHSNLFGYYGGHYNFLFNDQWQTDYAYDYANNVQANTRYSERQIVHNLYMGGGLGLELHYWVLNYSLMAGYCGNVREEYNRSTSKYANLENNNKWKPTFEVQPSIEAAIFYAF
jgi:hypothetical protein